MLFIYDLYIYIYVFYTMCKIYLYYIYYIYVIYIYIYVLHIIYIYVCYIYLHIFPESMQFDENPFQPGNSQEYTSLDGCRPISATLFPLYML